eukprot:856994_1
MTYAFIQHPNVGDNFQPEKIAISIHIVGVKLENKVIMFMVALKFGPNIIMRWRGFDEFKDLNTRIKKEKACKEKLKFPKSKLFGETSPKVIAKRVQKLAVYLQDLAENAATRSFLTNFLAVPGDVFDHLSESNPLGRPESTVNTIPGAKEGRFKNP